MVNEEMLLYECKLRPSVKMLSFLRFLKAVASTVLQATSVIHVLLSALHSSSSLVVEGTPLTAQALQSSHL